MYKRQDEWLGIETGKGKATSGWRLTKMDELPLYLGTATTFKALIARDQRLLTLAVALPAHERTVKLAASDTLKISQWLGGQ